MAAFLVGDLRQRVIAALAKARALFCGLDYDGTLAPIAPTPAAAVPVPGTAELLAGLAALPATSVAIVSGRPVDEVRSFLDVPGVYYVGVHGIEVRLPNGKVSAAEGTAMVRAALPAIRHQVEQALGARPGILIEDKGAALACHYRLASTADGVMAREILATITRTYQQRGVPVSLVMGHEVAELRSSEVNKGKTVRALLARLAPSPLPLFIGDDQTDEDAFQLLPSKSVTIRVAGEETPTRARYRLETPNEVHDFLAALLSRRAARTAATVC